MGRQRNGASTGRIGAALSLLTLLACTQAGAQSWPTYHGDFDLSGCATATLPDTLEMRWRFRADAAVRTTPVADGRRVFFTSASGRIYALGMDGAEIWSRVTADTNGVETFEAPPLSLTGALILGGSSGRLYSLAPDTGETNWVYETGGSIMGTPNADPEQGRVFVVSQPDGAVHCVRVSDGAGLWKSEKTNRCDGSPAVGEGRLAYGNCDAALYVFAAGDGKTLGRVPLGEDSQVAGGVALRGGLAFSGSRSGKVYGVDLAALCCVWTNSESKGEVFSTPAVSGGAVLFGSGDGRLYAVDRGTGRLRWSYDAGETVESPVIAGDRVVASAGGKLLLLKLESGELLWSQQISDRLTSPAVAGGGVVVGGDDGQVTAWGGAGGALAGAVLNDGASGGM